MNRNVNILNLINGTTQGAQTPLALDPSHFVIDERNKMQLMAYCADIGSVLDYYNLNGKREGRWDSFLLSDVSVLASRIAQYDGSKNYTDFLDFLRAIEDGGSKEIMYSFVKRFFNLGFDVVIKIDEWYKLSNQNFKANSIAEYLSETIESRGSELLTLYYNDYFTLTENIPSFKNEIITPFEILDPIWLFNPFPDVSAHGSMSNIKLLELLNNAAGIGKLLFSLQTEIVNHCAELFNKSLMRNDIPPHIGLMLSFADIFKNQQAALNSITSRHLDFYYQKVLLGNKQAATPDSAFIVLQLAKGKNIFKLPKESELLAGNYPDGKPIIFTTTDDSIISDTNIIDYRTLVFPDNNGRIVTDDLYEGKVADYNNLNNPSWPLFNTDETTDNLSIIPATLGFAFSCSDLLLAQGTRTVDITFALTNSGVDAIKAIDVSDYFQIQLTSLKGWYAAIISAPVILSDANTLLFSFTIAPSDLAIVPYNEKIHGPDFSSPWPICKFTLTTDGKFSYQTLQKLAISKVTIDTTVTGVYDFLIENDSGKLSTATPFIPFNNPSSFGNLYIGGQEFFVKKLSYINFLISWDKLPGSFANYYQAYNNYYTKHPSATDPRVSYQNQLFTANVFELSGEVWQPVAAIGDNPDSYCLFTSENGDALSEWPIVLDGLKKISINGPFSYNPNLAPFTSLNNDLLEGFFCITPINPAQGFGFIDYPTVVSSVTLDNSAIIISNAKLTTICKKKTLPLPNVPYTPKINGLEIEYRSEQEYQLTTGQSNCKWFYMHPFGIEQVQYDSSSIRLLPSYAEPSYVYFGLDTIQVNTELSFLFSITNRVKSIDSTTDNNLTYECYTESGWKALILNNDGTNGFQRTGILSLVIPENITDRGGQVPSKLYWLRFGCRSVCNARLSFVSTQAVSVTRSISSEPMESVSRGSISKFRTPIPEIKKIEQPENSFGGSSEQTEQQFRNSKAGRLRYKQRMLTAADVEACLLNEFPQLYKVTATPAGYANPKSIGLLDVVVTPWTNAGTENCYRPMAPIDLMLDVLMFLKEKGIPSIKYEIANPDFSILTVSCNVIFSEANKDEELASKLNEDLRIFLSPWISENPFQKELSEGNDPSLIYSFIKSRKYIKYVSNVTCSITPPQTRTISANVQLLIVSADQHNINSLAISESSYDMSNGLCVGENYYIKD